MYSILICTFSALTFPSYRLDYLLTYLLSQFYRNAMQYIFVRCVKGYGWLKDKILGEEGRRQQAQLREIGLIAERVGCSLAQLAIGQFL